MSHQTFCSDCLENTLIQDYRKNTVHVWICSGKGGDGIGIFHHGIVLSDDLAAQLRKLGDEIIGTIVHHLAQPLGQSSNRYLAASGLIHRFSGMFGSNDVIFRNHTQKVIIGGTGCHLLIRETLTVTSDWNTIFGRLLNQRLCYRLHNNSINACGAEVFHCGGQVFPVSNINKLNFHVEHFSYGGQVFFPLDIQLVTSIDTHCADLLGRQICRDLEPLGFLSTSRLGCSTI